MKYLFTAALVLFAATACTKKEDFIAVDPGSDAVIFTDDIALADGLQIIIRRVPSGDFVAESFELYNEKSMFGQYTRKARPLFSRPVNRSTYDEIVSRFDGDALMDLSRRYPPSGLDGWTWRLQRILKGRKSEFTFWCPEDARDLSGGELQGLSGLLDLGRQISRAAGALGQDAFRRLEKEPNQALQPTRG
jgi:hypothetical protein